MPALEPVEGRRVVASPAALDAAEWRGESVDVLRIAPDEALGVGATDVTVAADPDAIVEAESGFSIALLGTDDLTDVAAHVDWEIPDAPGALAQGKVAGVPARLLIGDPTLLVVQTSYADELRSRLGW